MSGATQDTGLVSCIVPVFNGESYLSDALDSIFAQSYRNTEVIVVDDGSTDSTPEVVRRFSGRVIAVRQDNAGPAAARNFGIQTARGEFVAFLDADDLWDEHKLEHQLARFEARPKLDLCVTHARNFWIDELHEERSHFQEHRIAQAQPAYVAATLLARRRAFEITGPFNANLAHGHSTEWFMRAAELGLLCELVPEVLYHRRLHHTNRTRQFSAASREEFLHLVKANLDRKRGLQKAEPAVSTAPAHDKSGS